MKPLPVKHQSVSQRPRQVAIVCDYDPTRWFPVVQAAIARLRQIEPMRVFYLPPDPAVFTKLASFPLAGLIVDSGKLDSTFLTRLRVPIVDFADHGNSHPWPSVQFDQAAIGRLAAQHLLDRGIRRFAAFSAHTVATWSARLGGFHEAVRSRCPDCPVCYAREDVDVFLRRILAGTEFPVGLFAPEDDYAEWILSQFLAQGVQVPRDIAVVGVGNQATANFRSSIPISSVQFPTTALGERAADMLLDAMSGRTSAKTTPILPLRVISRESTGAGSARDELVEQAMNLMHEYVGEASISEASLASLLGVGLVTLRSRCLEVLGRCPSDIWRNIRLQTAEDLLIGTELTVDAISRRCGYSGARAFIRAFKSATGQPPALWRKAARVPVA